MKKINLAYFIILPLFSFLLLSFAEEQINTTAYYPAPYGVYNEMRVNYMSAGNNSAELSGTKKDVLKIYGRFGVNTSSPVSSLEIHGTSNTCVKVACTSATDIANCTAVGACYYNIFPKKYIPFVPGHNEIVQVWIPAVPEVTPTKMRCKTDSYSCVYNSFGCPNHDYSCNYIAGVGQWASCSGFFSPSCVNMDGSPAIPGHYEDQNIWVPDAAASWVTPCNSSSYYMCCRGCIDSGGSESIDGRCENGKNIGSGCEDYST